MRGRKNPDIPTTTNILPCCRVCGEPGTGFHYGVTTCGACKGFFRRSLQQEEPYPCLRNYMCHVGRGTNRRKSCPKCRYDKCIAVGMCKESCKVGRYSRAKKSKDIKQAMEEGTSTTCSTSVNRNTKMTNEGYLETHTTPTTDFESSEHEDYSQGDTDNTVPSDAISVGYSGQSLSSNEDDDTDFQTDDEIIYPTGSTYGRSLGEPDALYVADHGVNGYGESSYLVDHLISRSVDYGTGHRIDDKDCTSSTITQDNDDSHRAPSYTVLNSRVSSTDDPTSNGLGHSIPFPPTTFKNYDVNAYNCTSIHDYTNTPIAASMGGRVQNPTNNNVMNPIHSPPNHTSRLDSSQSLRSFASLNHHHVHASSHGVMEIDHKHDIPGTVRTQHTPHISAPLSTHGMYPSVSRVVCNVMETQLANSSGSHSDTPDSNSLRACDDHKKIIEFKSSSDSISSISKRSLEDRDEGNQSVTKKRFVPATPDSSENSRTLVPFVKDDGDNKPIPFLLRIVAPDPMKYVLSTFDQFHFNCFEKQSLAPLLKLCYDTNDWVDDYVSVAPQKQTAIDDQGIKPPLPMNAIVSSLMSPEVSTSEQTYIDLFDYIQATHANHYGPESTFLSAPEITKYMEMFDKICQLHDSLKGSLNLIDDDKYFRILEATGFDVDNRKEYFRCLSHDFDKNLMKDLKFYRALPGFKMFSLKDRLNLTKSNFILMKGFSSCRSIDVEKNIYIEEERCRALRLFTYTRVVGLVNVMKGLGKYITVAKNLEMTFQEMVILKAYFVTCPEFIDDLEDRQLVTTWNDIYLNCLIHHMRKSNGANADDRLNKLFQFIGMMKSMRDEYIEARVSMRGAMKGLIDENNQLMKEFFIN